MVGAGPSRASGAAGGGGASGPLTVSPSLVLPAAELSWRFSRSTGPGGQSVNTTDSSVELRWDLEGSAVVSAEQRARLRARCADRLVDGAVVVVAREHRSQLRNREAARARLAALLRAALAPPGPRRRPTRPSRGSVERRLDAKKRRGATKATRRRLPEG